jgi:hypothetical protein
MKTAGLFESVDFFRIDANRKLDPEKRSDFGQFMTPTATARLMASMFKADFEDVTLLDAGAGVGSDGHREISAGETIPGLEHDAPSRIDAPGPAKQLRQRHLHIGARWRIDKYEPETMFEILSHKKLDSG